MLDGRTIAPMKGVAGQAPRGDDWVYELKWDGMRIVAFIANGVVRLQSSNGRDVTASFPELGALSDLGRGYDSLVLDGEAVAFADGKPSFGALQQRMHVGDRAEAARRAANNPVIFVGFDLLHLNGHDTMGLPLRDRRTLLEQVIDDGPAWRLADQYHGEVDELVETVTAAQLEGIMAKRSESTYEPGKRSKAWIKVKPRQRQEFVIGGWISGRGTRAGGLGSLLLGYYDHDSAPGDLLYAGSAGSGLTESTCREWQETLTTQPECPFTGPVDIVVDGRTVHWCAPDHVAELAFGEWPDGQHLRHPVVLGRRTDKAPTDVVRES